MAELTCQQCQELAAELALDVLPGRDRAEALAHLDGCAGCRETVAALTATADRLVELLPGAEPSAGFEQRVMTALAPPPPPRARRWRVAVAAAGLAIVLATGGWMLGRASHDLPQPETDAQAGVRTVMFAPLTTENRQIGEAYVYPGQPSWVYLALDIDNDTDVPSSTVRCELVRRDGSTVAVGTVPIAKGYRGWGGPAAVDRETLATARLINSNGHTVATAHFRHTRRR